MLAVEVRASSGKSRRRVSPWLMGLLVLGLLTVIGAVIAILILSSPSGEPRLAAPPSPAPEASAGGNDTDAAAADAPVKNIPPPRGDPRDSVNRREAATRSTGRSASARPRRPSPPLPPRPSPHRSLR